MLSTLGALAHTLLVLWLSVGIAPIYKYVDDQGNVTYSNNPAPGAKVIVLDPAPPPAPPPAARGDDTPRGSTSASKPRQATPANFPRVDGDTQRKRDVQRRAILDEELQNEQKALAEAKKALQDGEKTRLGGERNYQKYLDRVQALKDTVQTHEKNVEAIRRELGNQ